MSILSGSIYRSSLFLVLVRLLIFSFKRRPLYSRFPLNSKLYGLNILFVCFGQEENPRWKSKQSCSVLQPVACPLSTPPLIELSWFIQKHRCCVVLHTVQCCTVWRLQNCLEWGKLVVAEFKQSALFVLRQLAHVPVVVLSDSRSVNSVKNFVTLTRVCKWTAHLYIVATCSYPHIRYICL